MSLKERIDIAESPTRGLEHKASQTNISYGRVNVIIVLK